MRLFIAATVAASLFATNLLAAEAVAPLPAGKPAGVQKAQDADDNTIWWVVGVGAVVAVVAIAASGSSNKAVASTPVTTTTS